MPTLLQVVVGSRAYGLDDDRSDTDLATIYADPTDAVLALAPPPAPARRPPGGDEAAWEVRRFMLLALAGNPTVLEALWAPTVLEEDRWGAALRAQRRHFLSRAVIACYRGYAAQQAARLERRYLDEGAMTPAMWKHLAHMCRLMLAGAQVVATGEVMVALPPEYRQAIRAVKGGGEDRRGVMDWFGVLQAGFDAAVDHCVLPERPSLGVLNTLLLDIRHAH